MTVSRRAERPPRCVPGGARARTRATAWRSRRSPPSLQWYASHGTNFLLPGEELVANKAKDMKVVVMKDGPYIVSGGVPLAKQSIGTNEKGESMEWVEGEKYATQEQYALCRCGHSKKKPYCDGTHKRAGFDGTETASREPYLEQAGRIDGPTVSLTDAESLCAFGRFCDAQGQVWNRVERPGAESAEIVRRESRNCPGGRLVAWEREGGVPAEPDFAPSIGLVEDPAQGVSGGVWVRGGIQVVAADGFHYQVRNRVALCRCGASSNKPLCDGSHASVKFRDDR